MTSWAASRSWRWIAFVPSRSSAAAAHGGIGWQSFFCDAYMIHRLRIVDVYSSCCCCCRWPVLISRILGRGQVVLFFFVVVVVVVVILVCLKKHKTYNAMNCVYIQKEEGGGGSQKLMSFRLCHEVTILYLFYYPTYIFPYGRAKVTRCFEFYVNKISTFVYFHFVMFHFYIYCSFYRCANLIQLLCC